MAAAARALAYFREVTFAGRHDTRRPAHLPTAEDLRRYMVVALLAVLPAVALAAVQTGGRSLALAVAAFAGARLVELTMARARRKPTKGGSLTVAVLLSLVLPLPTPFWLAMVAAAFGALFAREVFGGTGENVFNPVLIAQAFVTVSYPALGMEPSVASLSLGEPFSLVGHTMPFSHWSICAIGLAGIVLLVTRAVDARPVAGTIIAAGAATLTLGALGLGEALPTAVFTKTGGFLFGALVLAGDPATLPATREARTLYGLLIGLLAALISAFSANADYMMYAILLGNMIAPSLEAAVLAERARGSRQ
jgi:Na+-transporting NADH:ubiquinone oxidoreductase subunit B